MVQAYFLSYMVRSRSSSGEHRIEREKGEKPEGKTEAIWDGSQSHLGLKLEGCTFIFYI